MDFPNTKSDSSAELSKLKAPGVDKRDNRMVDDGQTSPKQPLGDKPIEVDDSVDYAQYSGDSRICKDFAAKDDDEKGNAPLDGIKEIEPFVAKPASKITTEFSKR